VAATVTTTLVEQIVFVTVPTTVERIVEKTQTMLVTETVPIVVDRVVHVPVERILEKTVEKVVQQLVEVPVERLVEVSVSVDRVIEVTVPVDRVIEVSVPVDRVVQIPVPVDRVVEVPVPVDRIVEVHVPVDRVIAVERVVEKEVPVEEMMCHEMQQRKRRLRRIEVEENAALVEISSQSSCCSISSQQGTYSMSLQWVVQRCRREAVGKGAGGRPTSLFEKWQRFQGNIPFPQEDLPAVLQEFMRAHSHAEGHWIRYDEGVREYIRHNVDDDMLSRIQRWDRDHALLVDGQPGPALLEAPRVSYMATLTTTTTTAVTALTNASASLPPVEESQQESHDWKAGARIGEASNPGPNFLRAQSNLGAGQRPAVPFNGVRRQFPCANTILRGNLQNRPTQSWGSSRPPGQRNSFSSSSAARGARRSHPPGERYSPSNNVSTSKLGIARGRNFSYAAGRESRFFNTVNNGRQRTFEYDVKAITPTPGI